MTTSRSILSLLAILLPLSAGADIRDFSGILFPRSAKSVVYDAIVDRHEFRMVGQQKVIGSDGLNNYLASENLDSAHHLPGLALEYTNDMGLTSFRQGGRIAAHQGRVGALDGSNSFARITYWNFQYLFGAYLVDSRFVRWDVNAALGLGWASVEADKGTRLSRYHASPTDFAFPARLWTSVSLGYAPVYLILEGGYEWGRIAHFGYKTDPGPTEPDNFLLNGAFVGVGLALSFGDSINPPEPPQRTLDAREKKKLKRAPKPTPLVQPPTESEETLEE